MRGEGGPGGDAADGGAADGGAADGGAADGGAADGGAADGGAADGGERGADGPGDEGLLGGLLRDGQLAALEDLPGLVGAHADQAGLAHAMLYVADLQQQFLLPLPGQRDETGAPLDRIAIDTTIPGLAFRGMEPVQGRTATAAGDPADPCPGPLPGPSAGSSAGSSAEEGPRRLWVPLLNGTERLGVLGVIVPHAGPDVLARVTRLAGLVTLLVQSKRPFSDVYAQLVRTRPMALSAEVLWNLMPGATFANDRVVVSAALEPAYEVGGDAFDFALNGDVLRLSIFDAMGHDTSAGLTATIAVGCWRKHRREGADVLAAGDAVDDAIAGQFATTRFATGILADLDTRTGWLVWANRGHPPPVVLRRGQLVATLDAGSGTPMGLGLGVPTELGRYQLEPGDRLLLYTDGVIEAQDPHGELFGLDRFIDFVIKREADGVSAPETLRRLINTILDHQRGWLQDDATVLLVEWCAQPQHTS
ncbi:serine/threonine-protein phosphatase [Actinomadura sp. ATCC 31491]|uniref:Serine/threonine-protein phosphatase n=1 Tax=Actinomadura luzonensis TaxID=2805427 RepID=A0ABT0G6P1_9ACTN|nr:PP2C family protein-serine/threonine phosphatase [Actinomadura luzonensis]MCK2220237.1 serine/threonine-protein phosphatase [Actinomadura luzonensis]